MGRTARPWHRKHDGWWYATVLPGTPATKLLKAPKTKANERKAFDALSRLQVSTNPNATFDEEPAADLIEAFLDHSNNHHKATTYRTYCTHLNYFAEFCGRVPCRQLTLSHAETFLTKQAEKKSRSRVSTVTIQNGRYKGTIRKHVVKLQPWGKNQQATFAKSLRSCWNWAVAAQKVSTNPFATLSRPFVATRQQIVSAEVLDRMSASADDAFKNVLVALRNTGCRPSEIARLTAAEVDMAACCWVLPIHKTDKDGQPRIVWLNETMVKTTKRLMKENPSGPLFRNARGTQWTKNAIVLRFSRLRAKLGLPKGTIAYALRHTFVTEALVNGVPMAMVAELVGHKNDRLIRSTYGHLRQKSKFMQSLAETATRRPS